MALTSFKYQNNIYNNISVYELVTYFFFVINMSNFEPNEQHLRHVMIFLFSCFLLFLLVETYIDVIYKERVNRAKKFENKKRITMIIGRK